MRNNTEKFIIGTACLFLSAMIFLSPALLTNARAEKKERKILYYRNPMNPSITSKLPAKDNMGMDYIPVYEDAQAPEEKEAGAGNLVKLSQRDISLAGVVSRPVTMMHLFKDIRTVGRIAYDPDLYKAEEEFIQAVKTRKTLEKSEMPEMKIRSDSLVEASRLKLRLIGLEEEQVNELLERGEPDQSLIVSDKENPYVWVYADIYEYELSWVKTGQKVKMATVSFPGEEFNGVVAAIDPILNPMTRALRARFKIDNPELKLKPQMYADIFIEARLTAASGMRQPVLAIPLDAVLDTGMRKIVYLDLGNGSFLGKEVEIGPAGTAYVEGQKQNFYPVIKGLKEGDRAVTKANFLIDSQSQLTGIAASAYGGALGAKEEAMPQHQH